MQIRKSQSLMICAAVALIVAACGGAQESPQTPGDEQRGPMENAGQEVDETASDVEQGAENAVDETGDAIGEAGEEVDQETEDVE